MFVFCLFYFFCVFASFFLLFNFTSHFLFIFFFASFVSFVHPYLFKFYTKIQFDFSKWILFYKFFFFFLTLLLFVEKYYVYGLSFLCIQACLSLFCIMGGEKQQDWKWTHLYTFVCIHILVVPQTHTDAWTKQKKKTK